MMPVLEPGAGLVFETITIRDGDSHKESPWVDSVMLTD